MYACKCMCVPLDTVTLVVRRSYINFFLATFHIIINYSLPAPDRIFGCKSGSENENSIMLEVFDSRAPSPLSFTLMVAPGGRDVGDFSICVIIIINTVYEGIIVMKRERRVLNFIYPTRSISLQTLNTR